MCNNEYAYAALESEIRIKAISDGYDPTIGIMHEGSDGSSKFIFDLMEPERPKVDRAVSNGINLPRHCDGLRLSAKDGRHTCQLIPSEVSGGKSLKAAPRRRWGSGLHGLHSGYNAVPSGLRAHKPGGILGSAV